MFKYFYFFLTRFLLNLNFLIHHKHINKNQITNLDLVIRLLKKRGYNPKNIVDVGCYKGIWTKKLLKFYPNAKFYLFDANIENKNYLSNLSIKNENVQYYIKLLSNNVKKYNFYKMGSGSSYYEELTSHRRTKIELTSTILQKELPHTITKYKDNLIKIDTQGSEIDVLKGLKSYINYFEVIILEVSLHKYNKLAPLFNEVQDYLNKKNFLLYDIYDLKRLGNFKSFLTQFDAIFVKKNSKLFRVKF